ncbi:Uncharacterised protein [uncultured archaeon]|nr:Uncharacterised protein [uncultured archaeon]
MAIGSHTIPAFYLAQFAEPSGEDTRKWTLCVYQKNKRPRISSTERQGFENGYFGPIRDDGKIDTDSEISLEQSLRDIEKRSQEMLVCARSPVADLTSNQNRNKLAFYMGLLFARATSRQRFSRGNSAKLKVTLEELMQNEAFVRDLADFYNNKRGVPTTREEAIESLRSQADSLVDRKSVHNAFIRDLQTHANQCGSLLFEKSWQVWAAPQGVGFITSDNPIVSFVELQPGLWHPGYGFGRPNAIVAFPLCSSACLMMGITGPEYRDVTVDDVIRVNETVIRCSHKFVYSRTHDDQLNTLIQQIGGTCIAGVNAFVGQFPNSTTLEDYLRKKLGMRPRILLSEPSQPQFSNFT